MKNQFTISGAYHWSSKTSEKAVKQISQYIINRFNGTADKKLNYNINYKRLRSSAGRPILDSIVNRIIDSQVIIFDITENNPNVLLELGYALAIARGNSYLSIYLICKKGNPLPKDIPSDLHGYFISEYVVGKKGEITFKDNNSLRMSIESDVKEYFNQVTLFTPINENE